MRHRVARAHVPFHLASPSLGRRVLRMHGASSRASSILLSFPFLECGRVLHQAQ
ncbi:hypothetical protein BCAR13_360036 [Paraburkholderia caribensis]|nr:hypothetical protein BCAR13_360036 [Paraburkholderia caribensis]